MKPESREQVAGIRRQLQAASVAAAERARLLRAEAERRCREASLFQAATRDVVALRADTSPVKVTPPALDHIVSRCLAKDPEERWQTAHCFS